jgi:hypothetical protein
MMVLVDGTLDEASPDLLYFELRNALRDEARVTLLS